MTIFGAIVVSLSKAKAHENTPQTAWNDAAWNWAVAWASTHQSWVVPGVAGAIAVIGHYLKLRGQQRVDVIVKKLLNQFRDTTFPLVTSYQAHRVTLFKHCRWHFGWWGVGVIWAALFDREQRWRWPWSGWLVAYERAGEFHLDSRASFYAPLFAPASAEGIAGRAFADRVAKQAENLPDITPASNSNDRQRWSESTEVPETYLNRKIKKKRYIPRSLWATHIEVDGATWGVLVVDSLEPTLPKSIAKVAAAYVGCLSLTLSKKPS